MFPSPPLPHTGEFWCDSLNGGAVTKK